MNVSKQKESIKQNIPGLKTRVMLLEAPVIAPVVSVVTVVVRTVGAGGLSRVVVVLKEWVETGCRRSKHAAGLDEMSK